MVSGARQRIQRLFAPVDAASLGVFRIVFGAAVAVETLGYLGAGWVDDYYITPTLHFTYLYLDFVRPWPGSGMQAHYLAMSGIALLVAAGCWYRVSSVLLFVMYTYVFLLEQAVYMNHHYLMCLLAFLLMLIPAERAFSVDRWRTPGMPGTVPSWTVWLLRFQLVVVYLYGAVAKLNEDWLRGEPMRSLLAEYLVAWPRAAAWIPVDVVGYGIAYGGILLDIALPLLLLRARTFRIGFVCALVFHGLNAIFLRIGIFSYLMVGAILIFLPPDWPRHTLGDLVRGRMPRSLALPGGPLLTTRHWLIACGVLVYVGAQILIPLRHLLYPGPVAWSEEGHRFSWRMMLRHKSSRVTLSVTDPATGHVWTIDPADDLTPRQLAKLQTFPDILLQYVHHHRDRLRAAGVRAPIITVEWMCSLNKGPPRPLVDSTINLAAEPRTLRPARWILPLKR